MQRNKQITESDIYSIFELFKDKYSLYNIGQYHGAFAVYNVNASPVKDISQGSISFGPLSGLSEQISELKVELKLWKKRKKQWEKLLDSWEEKKNAVICEFAKQTDLAISNLVTENLEDQHLKDEQANQSFWQDQYSKKGIEKSQFLFINNNQYKFSVESLYSSPLVFFINRNPIIGNLEHLLETALDSIWAKTIIKPAEKKELLDYNYQLCRKTVSELVYRLKRVELIEKETLKRQKKGKDSKLVWGVPSQSNLDHNIENEEKRENLRKGLIELAYILKKLVTKGFIKLDNESAVGIAEMAASNFFLPVGRDKIEVVNSAALRQTIDDTKVDAISRGNKISSLLLVSLTKKDHKKFFKICKQEKIDPEEQVRKLIKNWIVANNTDKV